MTTETIAGTPKGEQKRSYVSNALTNVMKSIWVRSYEYIIHDSKLKFPAILRKDPYSTHIIWVSKVIYRSWVAISSWGQVRSDCFLKPRLHVISADRFAPSTRRKYL